MDDVKSSQTQKKKEQDLLIRVKRFGWVNQTDGEHYLYGSCNTVGALTPTIPEDKHEVQTQGWKHHQHLQNRIETETWLLATKISDVLLYIKVVKALLRQDFGRFQTRPSTIIDPLSQRKLIIRAPQASSGSY